MTIPSISNIAFGDIDFAKLDYEKDPHFIMKKVFKKKLERPGRDYALLQPSSHK